MIRPESLLLLLRIF